MTDDVTENRIGDDGGAELGRSLASNRKLTELDLRSESVFVGGIMKRMSSEVRNIDNDIGAAGGADLGRGLASNTVLTWLKLSGEIVCRCPYYSPHAFAPNR